MFTNPANVAVNEVLEALQVPPPLPYEWSFWATWTLADGESTQSDAQLMGTCGSLPDFRNELAKLPVADLPVNVTINVIRQPVPQNTPCDVGVIAVYCPCRATADRFWQRLALAVGSGQFPTAPLLASVLAVTVSNTPTTTVTELFITPEKLGFIPVDALKAELRQLATEVAMKTFTISVKVTKQEPGPRHVPSPVRRLSLPLAA